MYANRSMTVIELLVDVISYLSRYDEKQYLEVYLLVNFYQYCPLDVIGFQFDWVDL